MMHNAYIHDACFQDAWIHVACIHDAFTHDACMHDARSHDTWTHDAYIYDLWSWCMCVWCIYLWSLTIIMICYLWPWCIYACILDAYIYDPWSLCMNLWFWAFSGPTDEPTDKLGVGYRHNIVMCCSSAGKVLYNFEYVLKFHFGFCFWLCDIMFCFLLGFVQLDVSDFFVFCFEHFIKFTFAFEYVTTFSSCCQQGVSLILKRNRFSRGSYYPTNPTYPGNPDKKFKTRSEK